MDALVLEGGFAEPVFGVQSTFRAVMDAFANPGQAQVLDCALEVPRGLSVELAAIALTLCDHDSGVWLGPTMTDNGADVAWLRFHTGAPLVADPADAQFALVADAAELPPLGRFALGTDEYPDRSTTIVLPVESLSGGSALALRGPGIKGEETISPRGLQYDFVAQWAANRVLFPRGIDLLLVADGQVIGLPRTTRISES